MATTVEKLLAESEIRQLIARYGDAVFRLDPEAYRSCWAKDGVWHAFGNSFRGVDAIVGFWYDFMKSNVPMAWHIASNLLLEIDGETARGRSYINETPQFADGRIAVAMGVYHDRFIVEDGRWCFASRRFDPLYVGSVDMTSPFIELPKFGATLDGPDSETVPTKAAG